ncbi:hypothetical protein C8N43_1323 [Litoreibacter ponti]|uniref:Uncharacterized protein n=1 Tax=Litoreibacter ponti TaxID=1510457 RepID=A0A2T6BKS5_9RHOB|nr:ankyrin repeat domain-containing protein [Litoreibacter ponti]PTX56663.1 hypothetical protein C8N43_1323 [Litoreibacter ponti]
MMFSRAAPTVLFTALCLAVAGTYVTGGGGDLTRPGQMSAAEIDALDSYYAEMQMALQAGDDARFEALINSQIEIMQDDGRPQLNDPDILPAPYQELRRIVMSGTPVDLAEILDRNPGLALNTPLGRYGTVPLVWATSNHDHMPEMIELLLIDGADPRFVTATGQTVLHAMGSPFHFYYDEGDVGRAIDLLPAELIAQPRHSGETPLHVAVANTATAQAVAFLERGADATAPYPKRADRPDLSEQPLLILALGQPDLVEALLFAGADPDVRHASGKRLIDMSAALLRSAEEGLQDRLAASAAEEHDRTYVADMKRSHDMIRAALDARLARGN